MGTLWVQFFFFSDVKLLPRAYMRQRLCCAALLKELTVDFGCHVSRCPSSLLECSWDLVTTYNEKDERILSHILSLHPKL